jgi:hypothetical protein
MTQRQSAALAIVILVLVLVLVAYQQSIAQEGANEAVRDTACRRGFTTMCD